MFYNSHIENIAEKLLIEAKCYSIPIQIEDCAKYLNINIDAAELDENVAGFLLLKSKTDVHIGYNKNNPKNRIRFTIAHELSHYILHAKTEKLFVDKVEKQIKFNRDTNSSTGEFSQEREANALAAALLMPQKLLLQEIEKHKSTAKEKIVSILAKKFKVSEHAITIRCSNLGFIDYDAFAS